jgi:uncharacterized protein
VVWLLATLGIVVLIDVIIRSTYVPIALRVVETVPPFNVPAYSPVAEAEPIAFSNSDGMLLRGSIYRPHDRPLRGVILFCPELAGNHWSALSYAQGLVDAGFVLVSFDFRGQGESDPMPGYEPIHWVTDYEIQDVEAAVKYIDSHEELQHLPLGVMGISRGSGAALVAAGSFMHVRAVCCEGAYTAKLLIEYFTNRWSAVYLPAWAVKLCPQWHLRSTLALARLVSQWQRNCRYTRVESYLPRLRNCDVLLISGSRDNYVHSSIGRKLVSLIPSPTAELWIVDRAKHNRARVIGQHEYDQRLVNFFVRALCPASSDATSGDSPCEDCSDGSSEPAHLMAANP